LIFGNPNLLKPAHLNKKKRKTGEGKENSPIKKKKQQLNNETASNSSAHDTNFQATILQNQPSFICSDLNIYNNSYNNIRNSTISIQPINNQNDHFHNNSQSFMPNSSKSYFFNSSNNQFQMLKLSEDKTMEGVPDI
jgi:hypothetical protein